MGQVRIDLSNFISVGLMAFIFLFAVNKGLAAAGKSNWGIK